MDGMSHASVNSSESFLAGANRQALEIGLLNVAAEFQKGFLLSDMGNVCQPSAAAERMDRLEALQRVAGLASLRMSPGLIRTIPGFQ
jgi:hypothetical protein